MVAKPQLPKRWDDALSALNIAIDASNHAREVTDMVPAQVVFTSAGVLFTTIKVGSLPVHVGGFSTNVYRSR